MCLKRPLLQENLLNVMGGPHKVTHPSLPESVLALALTVLYAEKSISLKQTEIVCHP